MARALPYLAAYGIIHGVHEWLDMFQLIYPKLALNLIYAAFNSTLIISSTLFLFMFGVLLLYYLKKNKKILLLNFILIIWVCLALITIPNQDIYSWLINIGNFSRYFIYLPGSIITGVALITQYSLLKQKRVKASIYLLYAGIAFFILSFFVGIIVKPSNFFPANIINTDTFLKTTLVPVQLFRGLMAIIITILVIKALNIFYFEEQQLKNIATVLQKSLLPNEIPLTKDYSFGVYYHSATSEATIGGDFYDFIKYGDGSLVFLVGDASGKGVEAAADTANVKNILRYILISEKNPSKVMTSLNNALFEEYKAGKFFTFILVFYDAKQKTISLINAGHPTPLVYDKLKNTFFWLKNSGVALAVTKVEEYPVNVLKVENTNLIILYTDGLTEARHKDSFFGEERLSQVIDGLKDQSAQEIADNLAKSALDFSGNFLIDDVLILVMKKK